MRLKSVYVCQQCGFKSASFLGKCPQCDNWNSFIEQVEGEDKKSGSAAKKVNIPEITQLSDIQKEHFDRLSSLISEFDRVLGGGIVKGSVVLVSGDPGVGKSTLLTQLALNIDKSSVVSRQSSDLTQQRLEVRGKSLDKGVSLKADSEATFMSTERGEAGLKTDSFVLYVAGEESAGQIKIRADRIAPKSNLAILNEVDVDIIVAAIEHFKPTLAIVDSIQTLITTDLNSPAGSVSQVRECASRLQKVAKKTHVPIFIVGHVTKDGAVAGPKTLEHLVDVVLSLEGDPTGQFRVLRANKNRFGPTDEVGIFDMSENGMNEVANPSKLFLETRQNSPGSVVVPTLTGLRPILVEIQALVTKTNLPIPRRTGSGIDNNRLQLLVAVLQKRLKIPLFDMDIFVNVTGGLKVIEPAADLGICMAIISSYKDKIIPKDIAFVGEIGLLGEIRNVSRVDKRVQEAKKLGYKNVITPENAKSLNDAVRMALEVRG